MRMSSRKLKGRRRSSESKGRHEILHKFLSLLFWFLCFLCLQWQFEKWHHWQIRSMKIVAVLFWMGGEEGTKISVDCSPWNCGIVDWHSTPSWTPDLLRLKWDGCLNEEDARTHKDVGLMGWLSFLYPKAQSLCQGNSEARVSESIGIVILLVLFFIGLLHIENEKLFVVYANCNMEILSRRELMLLLL